MMVYCWRSPLTCSTVDSSASNQSRYCQDGSMDERESSWFEEEDPNSSIFDQEENMDDIPFPAMNHRENSPPSFMDSLSGSSPPPSSPTATSNDKPLSPLPPPKPFRKDSDDEDDDVADVFKTALGKKVGVFFCTWCCAARHVTFSSVNYAVVFP